MRILLVTSEFPLPVNAGGPRRQLGLLEALAPNHDLHLLAREREPTDPALVDGLRDRLCAVVETFPAPAETDSSRRAKLLRWGQSIIRRRPPWMITYQCPALARRAAMLAPAYDVALILDGMAEVFVDALGGRIPIVLDKQNVLGASWVEFRPWGTGLRGIAIQRLALWQTRALERRNADRSSRIVVTSDDEADRFQRLYGRRPDIVLSAVPAASAVADPSDAPRAVVWLGDHRYGPNVDGLVRFARQSWRSLGDTGATLLIIGREPPPEVRQLEQLPGVQVLGYVDDLDQVFAGAAAAVAPLWAGAGIKMKTLTFMAAGLPVAGTPVAFEGIRVRDSHDALVADDPDGLANALRCLLDDRDARGAIGARGRDLVRTQHVWDAVIGDYEAVLSAASAARADSRLRSSRFVESSSVG